MEGQVWVENNSKSTEFMGIYHLKVELWNSSSPAQVENKEKPSRASLGMLLSESVQGYAGYSRWQLGP